MQAAVGDRLHVHATIVGHPERAGEIVEVRGVGGEPPDHQRGNIDAWQMRAPAWSCRRRLPPRTWAGPCCGRGVTLAAVRA